MCYFSVSLCSCGCELSNHKESVRFIVLAFYPKRAKRKKNHCIDCVVNLWKLNENIKSHILLTRFIVPLCQIALSQSLSKQTFMLHSLVDAQKKERKRETSFVFRVVVGSVQQKPDSWQTATEWYFATINTMAYKHSAHMSDWECDNSKGWRSETCMKSRNILLPTKSLSSVQRTIRL